MQTRKEFTAFPWVVLAECFMARTFFIRPVLGFSGLSFFYLEKPLLFLYKHMYAYMYSIIYYNRKYTSLTTTTNTSHITLAYIRMLRQRCGIPQYIIKYNEM